MMSDIDNMQSAKVAEAFKRTDKAKSEIHSAEKKIRLLNFRKWLCWLSTSAFVYVLLHFALDAGTAPVQVDPDNPVVVDQLDQYMTILFSMAAAFMTGWTAYRAVMTNNFFIKFLIFLGYVSLIGGAMILKFPEIVSKLMEGLNIVAMQTTPDTTTGNDNLLWAKTAFLFLLAVLFGGLVYFAETVAGHAIKQIDELKEEIKHHDRVIESMSKLLETWSDYQQKATHLAELGAYKSAILRNKSWLKDLVFRELNNASMAKVIAIENSKPKAKNPLFATASDIGLNANQNTDFEKRLKDSHKAIADIDVIVNQTIH